ncbi:MAG: hypothetical protein K2M16_07630 [Muribaculaceae bacterium]|nr:hypothetical protein [Muribaculaceae bacterium]
MQTTIDQLTGKISEWTEDANESITNQLQTQLGRIFGQVNEMVDNLQGQIDSMIDDVINKANPWFNRLNRVVDLYNKFAEKVNNVLENPNHYLQVAMFYNQRGAGVGMLSNSLPSPTPFVGGKGYVGLYASSYTAELLAPAYKKYVAVTNVYNKSDLQPATNAAELRNTVNNAAENFNKVVDGNVIRYFIPADKLDSNYIYEIAYQGLDYHGVTSTQKFYITVNK